MKTYYHATPFNNLASIHDRGLLRGSEGVIYLADTPKDAAKFIAIRGYREILICQVTLDEDLVQESFDHNENFSNVEHTVILITSPVKI